MALKKRLLVTLAAALLLPGVALAKADRDCGTLPTSALRPRACNPQAECVKLIPKNLAGAERDARQRECQNQPTSGTCYGPEAYNPREDCRSRKK